MSEETLKTRCSRQSADDYKRSLHLVSDAYSRSMSTMKPEENSELTFSVAKTREFGESLQETRTIVALTGELDFAVAADVSDASKDVSAPATIDLSNVRYVDSSVLTEFVRFANRIAPNRAAFTGLQPQVRRIFEIVRFRSHFFIGRDVSTAGPRG